MRSDAESIRIFPGDWLNPLPLDAIFEEAGFPPDSPLEVDVGCGKGRFLLARAAAHPETRFLGVDRMLRRIRKVDNKARSRRLRNLRVLRMDAYYAVAYLLPPEKVSVYYLFFPDPWPKMRHHDHRLFNARFIDAVHRTLRAGGGMHFATDHLPYFEEVKAALSADRRFEVVSPFEPAEEERTDFELYYVRHTPIGRLSLRKA